MVAMTLFRVSAMYLFLEKESGTVSPGEAITSNSAWSLYRSSLRGISPHDFKEARLTEADVTLDNGPHFLRPAASACPRFFETQCHSRPQVTRSRFNSLPVVLPPPLLQPAAAACAPQSAFGHSISQNQNYVTLAHSDVFLS